jgi:hypothetical protein
MSAPARDAAALDARFGGPCDRVNVNWQDAPTALHLARCHGPDRHSRPLLFAYLAVPVDPAEVPLVVTGIPDGAWWQIDRLWADTSTVDVLTSMGYEVHVAEIEFDIDIRAPGQSVRATIQIPSGQIRLTADELDDVHAVSERRALITDDDTAMTAFFGPESAFRGTLHGIAVEMEGPIELAGVRGLPSATLDQQLKSNRVFWRLLK